MFVLHPDENELCGGKQCWPFNDRTVGRMVW